MTNPTPPEPSPHEPLDDRTGGTARQQSAAAYLAWEAATDRIGLDDLDHATAELSLDGAEWGAEN